MKKIILLLFLLAGIGQAHAQKMDFWMDTGVKVQYGITTLYNSAIGDDPNWDYTLASSVKFGGKFGINWNYTGVTFDLMFGSLKGEFQNTDPAGGSDMEVSVSSADLYVMFRSAKHKGYFEIGPKMSFIGDVRSKNLDTGETTDPSEFYKETALGAALGFGTYVIGSDGRFSGILGLRFEYGFQDIVNEDGRVASEEMTRQPVNYAGDAASTNPIFVGLVFELNWGIGGVGQARCGEKSKFIWF